MKRSREVARLHGEVVDPSTSEHGRPVRWPNALPARTRDDHAEIHLHESHVHHHHAPVVPPPRSLVPGWVRVAALVMCLVLIVYVALIVMSMMDGAAPWLPKGPGR
jgi:hypothetical protein